jgi:hypothetical protein
MLYLLNFGTVNAEITADQNAIILWKHSEIQKKILWKFKYQQKILQKHAKIIRGIA